MKYIMSARFLMILAGMLMAISINAGAGEEAKKQPQQGPILLSATEIKWIDGPGSMAPGSQFAVLEGDPKSAGPVTMRIKLPANYTIAPHAHPGDERVTIVSGTLYFGLGEKADALKAEGLSAGSFFMIPAGKPMFAWTKEETIIQLNVMGPWGVNYLHPADDPRKK